MKKYNLLILNFFTISLFELLFNFLVFKNIFSISSIYILLLSLIISLIITIFESIFSNMVNKIISIIMIIFIFLLILSQFIYYLYYDNIFSIYSLFHGGQVFGFFGSIIEVIINNIFKIIILFIPLIIYILFIKKINYNKKNYKYIIISIILSIFIYSIFLIIINFTDKNKTYSSYNLYFSTHVPKLTVKDFGVLTEMSLDLNRSLFGFKEEIILNNINNESDSGNEVEKQIEYNMLNIDFEKLNENQNDETIISMNNYFKSITPTEKNKYTGMFEGKNLIVILAEAFSPMSINKDLTPTLYEMYEKGFQFDNFYSPLFYVSTSDGEYISLTSLLPKEGTWSMPESSNNYLPFVYGNIFKTLNYNTRAYHNGVYTFYNRNVSLPNMGYDFKACYDGLDINCGIWPQSDVEMIEKTVDEFINDEKFMTYYVTISGHLQYNYYGNTMVMKNWNKVKDLPFEFAIKCYLATQIELNNAVELLINKLKEANKLDDTVIVISSDHYPYGLKNSEIKGYVNYINDERFDIHKNSLLIWNNEMKNSIKIEKYASSLDILPTVLNLFNIKYDSRLLMGNDILSNADGLVIYSDRSWMSRYGKYDSVIDKFTSFVDDVPSSYVDNINNIVYNKFLMSKLVLEKNYYKYIKDSIYE